MIRKNLFLIFLYFVINLKANDLDLYRQKININHGWKYTENPTKEVKDLKKELSSKVVNLPHTWNQWDALDIIPGYRRSASWYHRSIKIPKVKNKVIRLFFEGSNISTEIYINGKKAGEHIGGYVPFYIDITKFVTPGKSNEIAIRVDNSYDPNIIPSQKADFFIFGGITRDLWIEILPNTFISSFKITPSKVTKESANTNIALHLLASSSKEVDSYHAEVKIIEKSTDKVVLTHDQVIKQNKIENLVLPTLTDPKLWSTENPHLYEVIVTVLENKKPLDIYKQTFGYRWYEFDKNGAFFLNGERLLLRGTHRHEDHAGTGPAMSNEQHIKDIHQIKEMGTNFLRLAHYPQDPIVYKTCDELGIIVWDELPWCRGGIGGDEWKSNTKRLLKEQIEFYYNHTSIFFWSLGNEIYWLPDFENGGDTHLLNNFLTELNDLAHSLDPSRMTAIRKYYEGSSIVDVFSPSIWSGWYAGLYKNYKSTLDKNQKEYKRFLHMEYGGNSHTGRHTTKPKDGSGHVKDDASWTEISNQVNVINVAKYGDQSETYITDLFDWYLNVSENQPNFAGNAQWAFKDFATPLRPEESVPYMNLKGLVDREGNPKDAYFVFKSYWAKDPFVYIQSHTWDHRVNSSKELNVVRTYSNASAVELFINGKTLGKKKKTKNAFPAGGLFWDVPFTEGENSLSAIAYDEKGEVAQDQMKLFYTTQEHDKAEEILLTQTLRKDGLIQIDAIAVDKNKKRVIDYQKRVYFSKEGDGTLLTNYGTYDKSEVIEMANGKASILLKPDADGKCLIEVRNQDFKGNYINIDFSKD
jgi:beta-galactosidase